MASYALVYKIKEITDHAEVIVDISISLHDDNRSHHHHDVGYAIIYPKTNDLITQIGVAWMTPDDVENCYKEVMRDMKSLCNSMRKNRGYE